MGTCDCPSTKNWHHLCFPDIRPCAVWQINSVNDVKEKQNHTSFYTTGRWSDSFSDSNYTKEMTHLRSFWELVSSRHSCFPRVSLLSCHAIISLRTSANFYTAVGNCFTSGIGKDQQQTNKFLAHSEPLRELFSLHFRHQLSKIVLKLSRSNPRNPHTAGLLHTCTSCLYVHAAY